MIKISEQLWGVVEGKDVYLIKMENQRGSYVELTNYGATLVSVYTPDKMGNYGNVVLGFQDLAGYQNDRCYLGSTVGRFANRIGQAKFTLDGVLYQLDPNDNGNCNHSGDAGFNSRVFEMQINGPIVSFDIDSADGDGGFPGNLKLRVSYQWTEEDELLINYHAVSDRKTIVNLTNHAYFNLNTEGSDVFDHELSIQADKRLSVWADYVSTGLVIPAASLSFRREKIGDKMNRVNGAPSGVNAFYVLNKTKAATPACQLHHRSSGRKLEVFTSYPGVLLYTGDFLPEPFSGLALECQNFPDSPNHPNFPSSVLNAGEIYSHHIYFKFSVDTD